MGKIGHLIHHEKVVDSTQKLATKFANNGAEEGVVISANIQTAGRGQKNRTWYSGDGNNIAMSIILRPNLESFECPQLTLLAAVAVTQAINEITSLNASIKWPNDILINEKKLVGILTEMKIIQNELQYIILGIGMNVNNSLEDFEDEISQLATSIKIETGKMVDKVMLMNRILEKLEILYRQYLENGFTFIKPLWINFSNSIGKYATTILNNQQISGVIEGISDDGVLLLKDELNNIHEIYSADVVFHLPQM